MKPERFDIAIVGGGLAGLVSACLLAKKGYSTILFEKKKYPFHRVCGEYISNEVKPFLVREELFPESSVIEDIRNFMLSSTSGNYAFFDLPLGGFGISRYTFDYFLMQKAKKLGVVVSEENPVLSINFKNDLFNINSKHGDYTSAFCIGSWGKRDKLDKKMNRNFVLKKSPYVGIKRHIQLTFPQDTIALHNFPGGYCGISQVDQAVNLCYLVRREYLKNSGSIEKLEEKILMQNPHLAQIFDSANMLFEQPLVINEVSFSPKKTVENHILMVGDTAGLITPLCGNGMAMAIHAAKLASESIHNYFNGHLSNRFQVEKNYTKEWNNYFALRLKVGRQVQNLFGKKSSSLAVKLLKNSPWLGEKLIQLTHGKVI